jgi:hypothetical protein
MDFKENNIEWVTGLKDEAKITLTLSSKRFINKVKRICSEHPKDAKFVENDDGTVYAELPIACLKISYPNKRELTEEEKEELRERIKLARKKRA